MKIGRERVISGGTWTTENPLVLGFFSRNHLSAAEDGTPDRIRTCAHGLGIQCSIP